MASDSLESILVGVKTQQHQQKEPKKPRLQPEQSLKCPRCDSNNTKFCYYNNYSLSQPRYFCKSCRRYWTKGGTLRNVPVGGGCRRNKRVSSARTNHDSQFVSPSNDGAIGGLINAFDSSDLAFAFARLQEQSTTTNNNINGQHQLGLDDQGLNQGDYTVGVPRLGLLDSIRSGIFEADNINSCGNFYFGTGNANSVEVDYDHVSAMHQELSSGKNVTLFGFPWPMNVNGNGNGNGNGNVLSVGMTNIGGEVVDTGRSSMSWNGELYSSWHHGLLNTSPLM